MKPVLMQRENETIFHKESLCEYSKDRMESGWTIRQNRFRNRYPKWIIGTVRRSKHVSELQKVEAQGWVVAGVWLDVVLVGMVLASVVGLTYTFLGH